MNTHAKQKVPAQVPGKESLDSESQRPRENEIVGLAERKLRKSRLGPFHWACKNIQSTAGAGQLTLYGGWDHLFVT